MTKLDCPNTTSYKAAYVSLARKGNTLIKSKKAGAMNALVRTRPHHVHVRRAIPLLFLAISEGMCFMVERGDTLCKGYTLKVQDKSVSMYLPHEILGLQ